jgi:hypothetical protein
MIGPRGMRNWWLILARKCDLVRLAATRAPPRKPSRARYSDQMSIGHTRRSWHCAVAKQARERPQPQHAINGRRPPMRHLP